MIRFGVCAKFDQLDAVIEAGYDYVELNLSKVAALREDEFSNESYNIYRMLQVVTNS